MSSAIITSSLQVLQSNAGYYVGRTYLDNETGMWFPFSRETEYFPARNIADRIKEILIKQESYVDAKIVKS